MVKKLLLLLVLTLAGRTLFSQCGTCLVNLPALPEDTIYLAPAPDGEVGVYYDADISFRMPKTTTPVAAVDPTIPPGLTIETVTITSVTNLPPGFSWEASQLFFETAFETDGCVKLCGTTNIPDSFFIQVQVTASVFGISQSSSFAFPVYIAPASSTTEGFDMDGGTGCGATSVTFTNNIPSNGNPGITYFWDFGNGNSSLLENPPGQVYSIPGVYPISYTATIDTLGYFLTGITILETGCDDFAIPPGDKPDLWVRVKNPGGNIIYSSGVEDNADLPLTFPLFLPITQSGNYNIEVFDEDLFDDEDCGSVNFNQNTTGNLFDGPLTVNADILHPVTVVESFDTVVVYPQPAPPVLTPDELSACGPDIGIPITVSPYTSDLIWFLNGQQEPALDGQDTLLLVEPTQLTVWVSYTSPDGCVSVSDTAFYEIFFNPNPPIFFNTNNLLSVANPNFLPPNYQLQWYVDGVAVPDANELDFCLEEPGTFQINLTVTDLDNGCLSEFSSSETFNPAFDCSTATAEIQPKAWVSVFPNPFQGLVHIQWQQAEWGETLLQVFDYQGREMAVQRIGFPGGLCETTWDLSDLPPDWYLLKMSLADGATIRQKLVKP